MSFCHQLHLTWNGNARLTMRDVVAMARLAQEHYAADLTGIGSPPSIMQSTGFARSSR